MHDLVGAYERVERLYRLYIKSAFPLRSRVLSEERDQLLSRDQVLSQAPLIETVPVYQSSGLNLEAATRELPPEYEGLAALGQKLFPPYQQLYQHQWQSLLSATAKQEDLVVTTGTGSGKTECFLLPLFAQLARESAAWSRPDAPPLNQYWWRDEEDKGRVSQWGHVTRPRAIRAIILYPLNALVEDQMRRLRMALDDDQTHMWLNNHRAGNRITFGRYTGITPESGYENKDSRKRLRGKLLELDGQSDDVRKEAARDPDLYKDVQYHFPRIDGGEMWSRWDMQDAPPDILITNYSMLNIMLMRSIENTIFEQTRRWLEGDPERQFFLIVDELHAYRGTPGTEVAYILRLLLYRLGLQPESSQLRILTTTASLEGGDQDRKFLREFFGRDRFTFISGRQEPPTAGARTRLLPYQVPFEEFARTVAATPMDGAPDSETYSTIQAMQRLAAQLGYARSGQSAANSLGEALMGIRAVDAIRDACNTTGDPIGVRATPLPSVDSRLFPGAASAKMDDRPTMSNALRGLLLAMGMSRRLDSDRPVQPVRGHFFFHNLQNIWVCANPNCSGAPDSPGRRTEAVSSGDEETINQTPTVGALHASHSIACSYCGSRVLDLVVCEVCGDVFLGGYKVKCEVDDGRLQMTLLTADQPDLEHMPDRVNIEQRHGQYAVFWPLPHNPPWSVRPQTPDWQVDQRQCRWTQAKLHRVTGRLAIKDTTPPKADEVPGWVYQVEGSDADEVSAMPTRCPRCDANYARKKTFQTPLRNHRTGFQKACQVIASGLMREMDVPTSAAAPPARKLVIFSDSRQDAAKLAAGMERDHYRDMVRLVMIQALRGYWPDLVSYLRSMIATSPVALATLQVLNPTLHAQAVLPPDGNEALGRSRFAAVHPPGLITESALWIANLPPINQEARDAWESLLRSYPGGVPMPRLRDSIRDKLLELGMCPGGSTYGATGYKGPNGRREAWWIPYNWSVSPPVLSVNPSPAQSNHVARMEDLLMSEVMYALFPHIARTLEGLGQGWVSYTPSGDVPKKVIDAVEAVIRQMGVRRLHEYSSYSWSGEDNKLRPLSTRYITNDGLDTATVQQQLVHSKAGKPSHSGLVLAPDHLTVMPESGSTEESSELGYRCHRCNAFYLHDVGICPDCEQPTALVRDVVRGDFDYYTELTDRPTATPFRMNCEELTGQTDRSDRSKRQRWFQGIVIGGEIEKIRGVDLLSVTTTMEAGVDIGALNVVMMANMPPRRFNYQQRVGRAGRRASGVSLAVTFCRGRSHDDFYYQRPTSITGDPPPPPYVDMKSLTILRRVLRKEVLRQAFERTGVLGASRQADSVHGEFGSVEDWEHHTPQIQAWLRDPANEQGIASVLKALCVETEWSGAAGVETGVELLDNLRNQLVDDISEVVNDPTYVQTALSERLANAGLLPMFGFPTRVRLLYTSWPRKATPWPPEEGVVDRDLDTAISQFAPGSQTIKDKAVHTAIGVADFMPAGRDVITQNGFAPSLPDINPAPIGICDHCQAVVPLDGTPRLFEAGREPQRLICPVCQLPEPSLRPLDTREPKGFFTDLAPQDFEGQFEWRPRSTRPSLSINTPGNLQTEDSPHVGNSILYQVSERILSVNDNGGRGGFDFKKAKVYGQDSPGAFAALDSKHYGNGEDSKAGTARDDYVSTYGTGWRVALVSRRKTDILLIKMRDWPIGIFADPTKVEGRAAWYSFAFWARIAAGTLLDVDALELQAGFRSMPDERHKVTGQAFLCDQLENGAGYCRFLAQLDQFTKLLSEADPGLTDSIASKWLATEQNQFGGLPHAIECDTSCNLCLRDFQNLSYHGLLDWRLALDMAQLAASAAYPVDLMSSWVPRQNPWLTLSSPENGRVPGIMRRIGYGDPQAFASLRGYVRSNPERRELLLERHPLWTNDHPDWIAAEADAHARFPEYQVKDMNPFRLLRRPADYL